MLMADNLVIDYDAVQELLNTTDQDAEKGAEPEEGVEGTDPLDLLPEQLPDSVDLSFSLDSAVQGDTSDQEAETTDVPASLIAGDYFTVKLPDGVTLQDTDQPIDIFELDENDEPTTVRIATAEAQDEGTALKVTLTEPEDLAIDQTDQAVDQVESTDQTEQTITSTRSDVELSVSLESSLLAEDDAELIWALQTSSDDEADTQEAKLTLPAAAKLIEQLGIELPMVEEAEEESTTEETTEETSEEQADAAPQADVTYEPVGNASGSASLTMNWYDNNDSDDKRPEAGALKESLSLTFSLDGGDPLPLNEENAQKYFGMDRDALAKLFSVTSTGVGTYTATASGLYTKVEDSNGTTHTVTWTLSSAAAPGGYYRTQGEAGSLNFQLLGTSTYTIVAKVGEEKLSMGSAPVSDFVVIDGSDNEVPLSVVNKQPGWKGVWDAESGTYQLTAPAYDLDGLPIEYGLTYAPETTNPTPDDTYTVTYDNAASANHGSSTTAVYDGGTATILRVGTTTFTATKQWLDAGDKQGKRPVGKEITFTLWRYSSNPISDDTAANAAQVTDAAGNFVTLTANVTEENDSIDLGALLASQYPGPTLEKYDNDGYAYYYGIREESSFANYTTVYGSVADDGQTATDTAPNYTDKSGNPVSKDGWTRDTNVDRLIYNNGSIGNRLSGQKTVEGEKEWHVAAFADQLNGVSCTFTLQSRVKGDENAEWTNTTVTKTLTDFTAETLTKDFSGTYDLYDLNGNELEYRWIETGVEQKYGNIPHGGTGFTQPEEGEDGHLFSTFTLFLRVLDEGGSDLGDVDEYEQVEFTSETWVENGVSHVRNTFDATVDEDVSKEWMEVDDNGVLTPTKRPEDVEITVGIYDGDVKVAEAVMDGEVDGTENRLTLKEGLDEDIVADFEQAKPTYQETSPDYLVIKGLPRYKNDGSRYNYRIMEGSKLSGWSAQSSYKVTTDPVTNEEIRLTTIVNTRGGGEGTDIVIEKKWADAGDASHRLAVKVSFKAKKNIYNSKDELVYKEGDPLNVHVLDDEGNLANASEVTITDADTWFSTVTVTGANDIPLDSIEVSEDYLISFGEGQGSEPAEYKVYTYEEAKDEYANSERVPSWVNTGWGYKESGFNNAHLERVSTGEHVYEVSYDSKSADDSPYDLPTYIVSNRRIGLMNITLEKTWKDGATKAANRPKAVYRVTCDDPGAEFTVDPANGQASVKLTDGNTLPLFRSDPDLSGTAPERLVGRVEEVDGRSTLVVDVPKGSDTDNTATTQICGLPKYDGNGQVVNYSVTEEWVEGSDHEGYVHSFSEPTYSMGSWHFKDSCLYGVSNTLVGSRDVTFFKEWNDAYIREGAGQRPDINLTLYRVSAADDSKPEKVTGYINWHWEALEENGSASQYKWRATAPNLAKLAANGYAYTYYAVENIPAVAARLDYQPVTFRADEPLDSGWAAPEDVTLSTTDLWNVKENEAVADATGDESGSAYAMREGGTFVNSLANKLRINGRKIWRNVPGDADTAKLPQILVLLQRRPLGSTEDWPEAYIEKNDEGKWVPSTETVKDGGVVAWTYELDGTGTTYKFTIANEGENRFDPNAEASLPRYDETGHRYEYRAVEVITGLIGTPALQLSDEQVEKIDFASADGLITADDVYAAQHGEAGSFVMRNTYAPEQGNLTVKKIIEGQRVTDDKFPDVTFMLYRYDPVKGEDSARKVDEVTIKSFSSSDDGKTGTATHTFEGLDVFTPNGEYWRCYVVEKAVNGYTTYVDMGDLSADAVKTEGSQSSVAMKEDATLVKADDTTPDFTFKNTYAEDVDLTLTGTKRWDDLGNVFETRPNELEITLKRHTTKQTPGEDVELQSDDSTGEAYLEWTKTDTDTWTYTISNLEQWAPDGTAWTYTVTEKLADGNQAYRVINGSAQKQGSDPDKDGAYTGTFSTLVNRLAGSASVKKSWAGDNNDEWGLRPASVTVELQAQTSSDGGTTWSAWDNAKDVLMTAAGTDGGITAEQTLKGSNWSYSWDVLPYQLKDGKLVQYRVVETKVGNTPVANPTDNGLDVTYPLTESYIGEGKTTISTAMLFCTVVMPQGRDCPLTCASSRRTPCT